MSSFIISLDFELHWGVRDKKPLDSPYTKNLLGARVAIPLMLKMFEKYNIDVTWATVGMLFAKDRDELIDYSPKTKPDYANTLLNPYLEDVGFDEKSDFIHFAPSLIKQISETEGQEIATHTWSHYYCLEEGQNANAFKADMHSAVNIAKDKGFEIKSIVFPRNQYNPDYDSILKDVGISVIRRNPNHILYREDDGDGSAVLWKRGGRLMDAYLPISGNQRSYLTNLNGLTSTIGSRFLRPYLPKFKNLEGLRLKRIKSEMRYAATKGFDYHLWWHPHNFGSYTEENLLFLERILEYFKTLESEFGMKSRSMGDFSELH